MNGESIKCLWELKATESHRDQTEQSMHRPCNDRLVFASRENLTRPVPPTARSVWTFRPTPVAANRQQIGYQTSADVARFTILTFCRHTGINRVLRRISSCQAGTRSKRSTTRLSAPDTFNSGQSTAETCRTASPTAFPLAFSPCPTNPVTNRSVRPAENAFGWTKPMPRRSAASDVG